MILVFLGPPGSGKGTQAKLLGEKLGIPQIVAGDMLREEAKKSTEIGRKVKECIDAGRLAPEEATIELIRRRIKEPDARSGFILDGFPRSPVQAKALEEMFTEKSVELDKVIYLYVPEEVAVQRLLRRSALEGRVDDNEEVIRTRFEVYEKETKPLIEYYQKLGKLVKLEAVGSINEVFDSLIKRLGQHVN